MSYAYGHLMNPSNTESGIAEMLLLAPVSAFETLRCPEAPFTEPGDEVKIRKPHVFKVGEGFTKVLLAPEKNKLDLETVGNKGFQKFDKKLTGFIAGSTAEVHEAIKNWKNKPHVILARDSNCEANMWYQIGCECEAAYMMASFTTGTTAEGDKGYEVTFSVKTNYVAIYAPKNEDDDPIDPMSQVKA